MSDTKTDLGAVERRAELVKSTAVSMDLRLGGVDIKNLGDMERIAHTLARGGIAVPQHCRDEPGVCFALYLQAVEWGVPVMSVINKSYSVNGRIAYESQLLHAVVEKSGKLQHALRHEYLGEGDEMCCKVWATLVGETEPFEYTSETLGRLRDGGKSPLWKTQPRVQILYHTRRNWARLYVPDVILGCYTPEEAKEMTPIDVTPSKVQQLTDRLKANRMQFADRGFDPDHIAREASARSSIIEGDLVEEASNVETQTTGELTTGVDGGAGPGAPDPGADAGDQGRGGAPDSAAVGAVAGDGAGSKDAKPKGRKAK